MQKNYFHNQKFVDKNLDIKKTSPSKNINQNARVDINKLLNRVKIDQKKQSKKKLLFFSFGILLISFMGIFIISIK